MGVYRIRAASPGRFLIELSLYGYLAYILLPCVPVWLPPVVRYGVLLAIFGCSFLGAMEVSRWEALCRVFLVGGIVAFAGLLYLGKWKAAGTPLLTYLVNAYLFWIALFFAKALPRLDRGKRKRIYQFLEIITVITLITTMIGSLRDPNASRILAGGADSAPATGYLRRNIGGYGFVYGLTAWLPYCFYGAKVSGCTWRYVLLIALSVWTAILTQYSFALAAMAGVFVLIWIFSGKRPRRALIGIAAILLAAVVLREQTAWLLESLRGSLQDAGFSFLSDRLGVIVDLWKERTWSGHALVRGELYRMSLDAFLANPVFGNLVEPHRLGGHSEVLDLLGAAGIVGGGLFCSLIGVHLRIMRPFRGTQLYPYYICSLLVVAFTAAVNTVFTSNAIAVMAFLVPVLLAEGDGDGEAVLG